jgi:hypothetical protein
MRPNVKQVCVDCLWEGSASKMVPLYLDPDSEDEDWVYGCPRCWSTSVHPKEERRVLLSHK